MNQTQHQRWAYRSAGLQALIQNQQHTIKTPVAAVLQKRQRGAVCRAKATERTREGQTCFQENNTSRTYRIQRRQLFERKQFLLVLRRSKNQLLACYEKYLFSRRRFLSREPVCLMMWACPLPRRNSRKCKYVQVLFVFVNQILWENPLLASSMDNKIG